MLFEYALQRWPLQRFGIRFLNFMQKKSKQSLVYIALTYLFMVMHENTATVTADAVRISSKNNILHRNRRSAQKEQILAKN